jgi:hypothetical protein
MPPFVHGRGTWHNLAVDFARAHALVAAFLRDAGARCAVIGGVAVAAYGNPRTTLDLDVVTDAGAQPLLVEFLESRGYHTLHRSSGFSNHRHDEPALGRVDVMYVSGRTADLIFDGAHEVDGPAGARFLVPKPEHLIAMKVHAMTHAPERTWQEMLDISYLVTLTGVDRDVVRGFFEKAGLGARWQELARGL